MRGIHDSGMVGTSDRSEQIALMERIFQDQRDMIEAHVQAPLESVPQIFVPYKEVLNIYRDGLAVPDDVTLVWPNDNHGYIRHLPDAQERQRAGGSGIYYHISYLGAPLAYLWLHTTPHSLIWYELQKAYDHGARTFWMLNVGDIKPAEIGIDFFFDFAWDVDRWDATTLPEFLPQWAESLFGPLHAHEIAEVLQAYFRLNHQRRPEHLQWYLPHTRFRMSPLGPEKVRERLLAMDSLRERVELLKPQIPATLQDAFFQLIYYPVNASVFANQRYFGIEQYHRNFNSNPKIASAFGRLARDAQDGLDALTRYYNETMTAGKWRHMMAVEPADTLWRSYRQNPQILPAENMVSQDTGLTIQTLYTALIPIAQKPNSAPHKPSLVIPAESFVRNRTAPDAAWKIIPGLGHTGASVSVFPTTAPSRSFPEELSQAPQLAYTFSLEAIDTIELTLHLLPTFPLPGKTALRIAVSLNDQPPMEIVVPRETGDAAWTQGVINASLPASLSFLLSNATQEHVLKIHMIDAGVVLDRIEIRPAKDL